jgi:hypothetical protein
MSVFPVEKVNECIASCDERIASVQSKLDNWKPYAGVMGLMAKLYDKEEDVKVFTEAPQMDNVKTYENNIKIIKVEKMMWNAFKNNSKKDIFKHILSKYDELMCLSYDIAGNMVLNGIQVEGEYLDYCKSSLDQREFIRKMCCVGNQGFLK